MKQKSIITLGALLTTLLAAYTVFDIIRNDYSSIHFMNMLIVIFIATLSIWLSKRYERLIVVSQDLKVKNDKLEESQKELEQQNKDYELLINSLDGAVFSLELQKNQVYFSKGAEQIFGYYLEEEFGHNPYFWKEFVHPDDRVTIEEDEKQLMLGHSTKVEFRIIHPESEEKWLIKKAEPIKNSEGKVTKINGQLIDITKRVLLQNELKQLAYFDDLTDLPNRKLLDRHIEKALARSKRHNHNFTLMFIDLDDFKIVNDTLGHEAGDTLLKEVVSRLNHSIRDEDLISRIGGDEFIVVFEETNNEEIETIAQRILDNVSQPYLINEQEAKISLSIGVSMYPDDGEDKETLIDHADKAMYFAKNNGKNNFKIYTSDLNELEVKKVGLLDKWVDAIQNAKIFNRN
ncbi:sensor domain-containing diguanylate cyclase [Bacillus sp. FJAT-45350]|uniref:sensor domain-containing diguanylate cyclase n=1 Tax=Bacillus sp. FJAT-45350 TaxID=2011014 RepID=UPI000BB925F0|nr:sensor domain-containing diguanylate cyclase [Bacillus sp. FJAT-45350]